MTKQFKRTCAECASPFTAKDARADFCSLRCKNAWNNRVAQRGKVMLSLYVHRRFNRAEARAKGVHTLVDRMVTNWVREDREAGRRWAIPLQECLESAVRHTAVKCA